MGLRKTGRPVLRNYEFAWKQTLVAEHLVRLGLESEDTSRLALYTYLGVATFWVGGRVLL